VFIGRRRPAFFGGWVSAAVFVVSTMRVCEAISSLDARLKGQLFLSAGDAYLVGDRFFGPHRFRAMHMQKPVQFVLASTHCMPMKSCGR
jgi:hypothetical protein